MAFLQSKKCDCWLDLDYCNGRCFNLSVRDEFRPKNVENLNLNNDPYLDNRNFYKQLEFNYKKHGDLIVAVDFDSTIYPFRAPNHKFPKLIKLLKDCKKVGFKIIIFTASAKDRYPLIKEYCNEQGIVFDSINEDLVFFKQYPENDWTNSKIYYNILLDDKAGLSSSYSVLRTFVNKILNNQDISLQPGEIV